MLIYFMPNVLLYILSTLKITQHKELIEKITVILLGIFLCTTYFNGSDWRAYELMYKEVSFNGIRTFYAEKGFYLYMLLFKILGFNFWWFFIITKLWCFYIVYLYMKNNTENIFFALMLFYGYMSLYLFIDCPLRNLIAVSIFLFSIKYLLNNKYFVYLICMIIAFYFHHSAIFMIFLPFIKKISKLDKKILIILIIILNIFSLNQDIIIKIISFFPDFLARRILIYMGSEYFIQTPLTIGSIEKLFLVIIILWNKEKIINKNNNLFLITMLLIYYLFYRLSFTIEIISRFTITYFILYYILNIGILINDLLKKELIKKIVMSLFFIYSLLLVEKLIYRGYEYVPYTSYLSYIFKEKPSYEYRSNYNFIKWEERFGEKYSKKK